MCEATTTTTKEIHNSSSRTEVPPVNNNNNNNDKSQQQQQQQQRDESSPSCLDRWIDFYWTYEFLILVVVVILLARAYPPLGATYLVPHITATWIAVVFIFIMAGLGLKTEEFSKAFQRIGFNVTVQVFNLGIVSAIVYAVSRALEHVNVISKDLADGMVVCACLPMTINMVLVLTKSSNGDDASAIFNAAFGNMLGVFVSPLLILAFLGVTGDVDMVDVFYKLALRVVVPVLVGQVLQKYSQPTVDFVKKYKQHFKNMQQYCLVFIVYTVFCKTFEDGSDSTIGDIFLMILFQLLFLTFFMALAWYMLKVLFPQNPKLRVMGLFGCTHKTVAMGVPLINAIYEDNPAVGLYTLPLLIWHPMQLVVGTVIAPKLAAFVVAEQERLGLDENDHPLQNNNTNDDDDDALGNTEEGRQSLSEEQQAS